MTNKSKNQELTKKQSTELGAFEDFGAGYSQDQATSEDYMVSKILAMQGISGMVMEGKAKFGEMRDSVDGKKIGDLEHSVAIIPFYVNKTWVESVWEDGKWTFHNKMPVTPTDLQRQYEEYREGKKIKNEICYDVYCFVRGELDMPYVVSFKGTSKKAGQKVITHFKKMYHARKYPFSYSLELSTNKVTNRKGTYVVFDVSPMDKATDAEMVECAKWFKMVQEGMVKVKEEENQSEYVKSDDSQENF